MIIHRVFYLILSYGFMSPIVNAQPQIQGGLYFGGINYQGDLAPSSVIISPSETRLDVGAFVYIKPNEWLALKVNYHHGSLTGSDTHSNDEGRLNRNLHFWTPLDELSASAAFFWSGTSHKSQKKRLIKPFITAGIGVFKFNPQAQFNGKWYELQPLSTEGQGLTKYPNRQPYKRVQICFPIGSGIQVAVGKRMELTFDLSLRKTLTDYLDDVSTTYVSLEDLRRERNDMSAMLSNRILSTDAMQHSINQAGRGEPKYKDWYIIGSVGIVAHIFGKNKHENFFKKNINYLNCKKLM